MQAPHFMKVADFVYPFAILKSGITSRVEEEHTDNLPVNVDSINYILTSSVVRNVVSKVHPLITLHCSPPGNSLCHPGENWRIKMAVYIEELRTSLEQGPLVGTEAALCLAKLPT